MRSNLRGWVSAALVLTTTLVTIPLSASDFSTRTSVIGPIGAVGNVDLRGVGISQEGTVFAGDRIRVHEKGYAKVLIGDGGKVELFENADVNINRDSRGVKIAMNGGMLGFNAKTPVRIDVSGFEVTASSDDAAANVAIMSPTTAGVRALSGNVTVRNLKTSESFRMTKGQERLLLKGGASTPSLGDMASSAPGAVPAPALPSNPAPKAPARRALSMDTGGWLAVIAGAAGGAIAIVSLVEARNNRDDIKELSGKIDTLSGTIAANSAANAASAAALQAQLTAISNASAISATIAQQQSQLAAIQSLAGQAQLALATANPTDAAAASKLSSDAAASQTRLNTIQASISSLQAQLSKGTSASLQLQLNALLLQEETERANSNKLAADLNALLLKNKSTSGVPQGSVGTTSAPSQSSASIPV